MPFPKKDFAIPANTAKTSPARTTIGVPYGEITGWFLGFRHGCFDRVGIRIYHGATLLMPQDPDEWLSWSGFMFHIDDQYLVVDRPFYLDVYGYNEDTTNEHKVFVGVEMIEIPAESTQSLLRRVLTALVGE